ncbi:MAG: twin-arginine translocase TatA/TatE family subunit [Crocinitomicaceae bacterium]|nr:twin-arginine translocase TatA/TatE family subunit [Crocinitomicaceae bacterium]
MILLLDDIAGSEILLILVFILIFFGSKSIPGIAKTLGKTMRQIKDASQDIQNEIKKSGGDFKKDLNLDQLHITKIIKETKEELEKPFMVESKTVESAFSFEAPKSFEVPKSTNDPIHRELADQNANETSSEEPIVHAEKTDKVSSIESSKASSTSRSNEEKLE